MRDGEMARYSESVIETARQYYVLEGKAVAAISEALKIPLKTVYNWVRKYGWDNDIRNSGGFNLFLEMQKSFIDKIRESIELGALTDPATVDSLWKLAKLMERMMPKRMQLSNLFGFMEDMVGYFVNSGEDEDFMVVLHRHVPLFADYLRKKYTSE